MQYQMMMTKRRVASDNRFDATSTIQEFTQSANDHHVHFKRLAPYFLSNQTLVLSS